MREDASEPDLLDDPRVSGVASPSLVGDDGVSAISRPLVESPARLPLSPRPFSLAVSRGDSLLLAFRAAVPNSRGGFDNPI